MHFKVLTRPHDPYYTLKGGNLVKKFIGGDYSATFSMTAPKDKAADLYYYFSVWLGEPVEFGLGLWRGFVAEMEINLGSFRYRRSLLEDFANRVRIEHSPTGPTFTAWKDNLASQALYGVREFERQAHYLTSGDADTFAQRLVEEMSSTAPKFVGTNTVDDMVSLNVTCVGHFFKIKWLQVPSMTYAINIDTALDTLFANNLPDFGRKFETNTQQLVGPPNEDPIRYVEECSTLVNSFNYYRVWLDNATNKVIGAFIDATVHAQPISQGKIGVSYEIAQPGFFKDISIPFYEFQGLLSPTVNNIIFANELTFSFDESGDVQVGLGSFRDMTIESIYDLFVALDRQNFIENREEQHMLEEEEKRRRKEEQENEQ